MTLRPRVAGLVLGILISASCAGSADGPTASPDQSSAEAALRSLYAAIDAKNASAVIVLFRAKNGAALSSVQEKTMRDGLARIFARNATHVASVRVNASGPLEPDALALLPPGTNAVRLTFTADGTGNECLTLPITNGTGPFAQLQGRWYVLEELLFGLPFAVMTC